MKDVFARCPKKTAVQVCIIVVYLVIASFSIYMSYQYPCIRETNTRYWLLFIFCRLKINHDVHEFILDSGTVANRTIARVISGWVQEIFSKGFNTRGGVFSKGIVTRAISWDIKVRWMLIRSETFSFLKAITFELWECFRQIRYWICFISYTLQTFTLKQFSFPRYFSNLINSTLIHGYSV